VNVQVRATGGVDQACADYDGDGCDDYAIEGSFSGLYGQTVNYIRLDYMVSYSNIVNVTISMNHDYNESGDIQFN